MSKALYRKYRPCRLADVVGQSKVTDVLDGSIKQGKISHAYLFIGPRGTGKTSVARIFAHEINNFKYEIEDDYVDIIEIDGASNRGIDDIRELREKALVAPTSGKYKIYIIDEVHMLTKEAFNALLKTLEEPPKHVVFIMATTDAHKVPVTITSRAQVFTFKLANESTMFDYLQKITKAEKIPIEDEAIKIIAKRGGGSFRDSLSLLDQISTLNKDLITKDLVISSLGLPEDEKLASLLTAYQTQNPTEITSIIKDLFSTGTKPETLTESLVELIVENGDLKFFPLLEKLTNIKAPFAEAKLLVTLANFSHPSPLNLPSIAPAKATAENTANKEHFDWPAFIEKIKSKSDVIYMQLSKANHELKNYTLHIYPASKISETILSAKNNQSIIKNLAGDFTLRIHSYTDKPKNIKEDRVLNKISDIMGGEVKNDGGKNPFN